MAICSSTPTKPSMKDQPFGRYWDLGLKAAAGLYLLFGLLQSFTFNQFHIFSRMSDYSFWLILTELAKMAGYLLVHLAVYLHHKKSQDILKLLYPILALLSLACLFEYGAIIKTPFNTPNRNNLDPVTLSIYDSINLFMPHWAIVTMFAIQGMILLGIGIYYLLANKWDKSDWKSLLYFPLFVLMTIPLNFLSEPISHSPDWFQSATHFDNFTIWHFLMFALVIFFTWLSYFLLKKTNKENQVFYLRAMAIILIIHFAGKDSMLIGDGYNIYNVVLSSIPLFICDIGKIIVLLSVTLRKKVLYDIAFFVHSAGALTVFFYFGRIQNFGSVLDYSFLYFTSTHLLLFLLSILPVMLGHTSFRLKDCLIPIAYYGVVILIATGVSVAITNASATWVDGDGNHLPELLYLNFAFTQVNPLPIEVPGWINFHIGVCEVNPLYLIGLYAVYIGLFFIFFLIQLVVQKTYRRLPKKANQ